MRKIKIAQIGINEYSHGRDIFNTLKKMPEVFEIAGYVLVEGERERFSHILSTFKGYKELTLDEVLNDPTIEAVTVETEEIHLTKYTKMAAEHGKHIHMEKPAGTDLNAFLDMMDCVKRGGKTFHIGYMYRYNPMIEDVVQRARKGEFGEIVCVEANMNCHHPLPLRDWLKTFDGGMTFFLGCHLLDIVLRLQGEPLNIVPLNKCSGIDGAQGEDCGLVLLEYPHGYSSIKTCSLEYGGYMRRQLVLTGTKGTVEIRPLEAFTDSGYFTQSREVGITNDWHAVGQEKKSAFYDRYVPMMRAFAEMVLAERENPYSYDYETYLYKTLLKCCKIGN